MNDSNDRDKLEIEFLMEGVTTRMQTAMEKLSESNRTQSIVFLVVIVIVVTGFILMNKLWFACANSIRGSEVVTTPNDAQVYSERLPELSAEVDDQ